VDVDHLAMLATTKTTARQQNFCLDAILQRDAEDIYLKETLF
jgi:hypothetical protein